MVAVMQTRVGYKLHGGRTTEIWLMHIQGFDPLRLKSHGLIWTFPFILIAAPSIRSSARLGSHSLC